MGLIPWSEIVLTCTAHGARYIHRDVLMNWRSPATVHIEILCNAYDSSDMPGGPWFGLHLWDFWRYKRCFNLLTVDLCFVCRSKRYACCSMIARMLWEVFHILTTSQYWIKIPWDKYSHFLQAFTLTISSVVNCRLLVGKFAVNGGHAYGLIGGMTVLLCLFLSISVGVSLQSENWFCFSWALTLKWKWYQFN